MIKKALIIIHNQQPYLFINHKPWKLIHKYLRYMKLKFEPKYIKPIHNPPNTKAFMINDTTFYIGLNKYTLNYYFMLCKLYQKSPYLPNSMTNKYGYIPQYTEEQFS